MAHIYTWWAGKPSQTTQVHHLGSWQTFKFQVSEMSKSLSNTLLSITSRLDPWKIGDSLWLLMWRYHISKFKCFGCNDAHQRQLYSPPPCWIVPRYHISNLKYYSCLSYLGFILGEQGVHDTHYVLDIPDFKFKCPEYQEAHQRHSWALSPGRILWRQFRNIESFLSPLETLFFQFWPLGFGLPKICSNSWIMQSGSVIISHKMTLVLAFLKASRVCIISVTRELKHFFCVCNEKRILIAGVKTWKKISNVISIFSCRIIMKYFVCFVKDSI